MLNCALALIALTLTVAEGESFDHPTTEAEPAAAVSHYESTDRDADGKIGLEEFRNRMTKVFLEIDADGDGLLDDDEFPSSVPEAHRSAADLDGDGMISHREFGSYSRWLFEEVDRDGDDRFDDEDLAAKGHEDGDR